MRPVYYVVALCLSAMLPGCSPRTGLDGAYDRIELGMKRDKADEAVNGTKIEGNAYTVREGGGARFHKAEMRWFGNKSWEAGDTKLAIKIEADRVSEKSLWKNGAKVESVSND
jgi:hypothetical protein